MANSIFVSPGVYTREKELTYVVRQVGVTTLGIAGETPQGPAFEPIFISNYDEYMNYFGGLDPEKFPGNKYPKYEANYIAKSYLTQSNQLFVTRILGLSGYKAGPAWGITLGTGEVVALIRSRGYYDANQQLNYYVNQLNITDISASGNTLGLFNLNGTVANGPLAGSGFSYNVSFNSTIRSYLPNVLGITPTDADPFLYVEEIYTNSLLSFTSSTGINVTSLLDFSNSGTSKTFDNYLQKWTTPFTPFVVSEVRGNMIFRLFRFVMISDGSAGNRQCKFSIINIKPDTKDFDLLVRDFNDTDENQVILERWTKLNLRFNDQNFIGRRIGTTNGDFKISSNYIMVEMAENWPQDGFPAGFEGYLQRDYMSGATSQPVILYKTSYTSVETSTNAKLNRAYLGLSDIEGIDQDFFDYKGLTSGGTYWTLFSHGFHMDISASTCTVENATIPDYGGGLSGLYVPIFDCGLYNFQTIAGIVGTAYEKVKARKFTFVPYGGFDGWDEYRSKRTNTPSYVFNGTDATNGINSGVFKTYTTIDGNEGNTSDWYAYYEGMHTFDNPIAVNVNVFTTTGINAIDNENLIYEAIDMVENQRADSLYIITTPDFSYDETSGITTYYTADYITEVFEGLYDSNYSATYWPWIQLYDSENYIQVWMPPTLEVVRNIALTDNIAFPWFATAGVQRGSTVAIKARIKLRQADRDILYENRINPMATFTEEGVLIWGNKTLQERDSALNRINVRRLLLQARKLISAVATRLLFEPNDQVVRDRFTSLVNPILDNIRKERGLNDFRVVVSNDPEEIDRQEMSAKLFLKPTKALEYIIIDFIITPQGASFDNI